MITIKQTRALLGIPQSTMALLLGTSANRVSEIERGAYGRTESKQMQASLEVLVALHEAGGIDKLIEQKKRRKS